MRRCSSIWGITKVSCTLLTSWKSPFSLFTCRGYDYFCAVFLEGKHFKHSSCSSCLLVPELDIGYFFLPYFVFEIILCLLNLMNRKTIWGANIRFLFFFEYYFFLQGWSPFSSGMYFRLFEDDRDGENTLYVSGFFITPTPDQHRFSTILGIYNRQRNCEMTVWKCFTLIIYPDYLYLTHIWCRCHCTSDFDENLPSLERLWFPWCPQAAG